MDENLKKKKTLYVWCMVVYQRVILCQIFSVRSIFVTTPCFRTSVH